jgi:hypothetical protein
MLRRFTRAKRNLWRWAMNRSRSFSRGAALCRAKRVWTVHAEFKHGGPRKKSSLLSHSRIIEDGELRIPQRIGQLCAHVIEAAFDSRQRNGLH